MAAQQAQQKKKAASASNRKMADENPPQPIPEHEIKQNSGVSAQMALAAMKKAYDLRQAANAAGDPDAREEILAKAINKEIEAESFGKAAKYTRSGAFQGLAAGAGLGVQPGVTLGKLTGALVGGTVATVTGLLGGGIGSVYGSIHGPFWDLGEMASHGVRGIIGDFPNWKSTPAQKRALEKMVMQTRDTQAPTQEELEEMKKDAPDDMPESWSQAAKDMTSWRPSMPSMPKLPSMPKGAALGLGGLGASMPWSGSKENQVEQQSSKQTSHTQQPSRNQNQSPKVSHEQSAKQSTQKPQEPPRPKEAPTPKQAPQVEKTVPQQSQKPKTPSQPQIKSKSDTPSPRSATVPSKERGITSPPKGIQPASNSTPSKPQSSQSKAAQPSESKRPAAATGERKKPRKLETKSGNTSGGQKLAPKKAPRKLEHRTTAATAA